ncbi:hypothetical protein SHJG_0506 [Streptomyces hygroscopicus subsp. jinggangensis 5008]|nr:hypothetical protein SHJG_0506 [Streptomyces hygroscopicus subsp. jinggangensis 5008]AGF60005.1 hypothetical protein SHJGH_0339 [Streptomyces hygroscopicus subsp. jinggangensis TL01]
MPVAEHGTHDGTEHGAFQRCGRGDGAGEPADGPILTGTGVRADQPEVRRSGRGPGVTRPNGRGAAVGQRRTLPA